jgi:hypothetical protein
VLCVCVCVCSVTFCECILLSANLLGMVHVCELAAYVVCVCVHMWFVCVRFECL